MFACVQTSPISLRRRLHAGNKSVCWRFQKCLLSVLERCPSYREYSYSKMTEKRQWPKPGVRLTEVSVKTELTVKHRSTFSNSHNKTKSNRVLHTRVFPRCIFPCSYDCFIQSTSHCVLWLVIENITRLKTALWLSSSFWTEIISFLDNACVCVCIFCLFVFWCL